jgi:hypothetical protein
MTQQAWFILEGLIIGAGLYALAFGSGMLIAWWTD